MYKTAPTIRKIPRTSTLAMVKNVE